MQSKRKHVAILIGSKSDLDLVQPAIETLKELEIPHTVRILSAHRLGEEAAQFASDAHTQGYKVLIAAAGKAAHLAGTLASRTLLPVIGLPISASLMGLDALLSTVQMPSGYPVATVGIDGAVNAALLAAQILALHDPILESSLHTYREANQEKVRLADAELQQSLT
ncbi:MAG: 5-(carboxyamino)imidazole ribonucleotide mutase [Sphaerochaetaceae bacterium]|jgi:5-(carboxyamino)imidazole ribonucleotide mutase